MSSTSRLEVDDLRALARHLIAADRNGTCPGCTRLVDEHSGPEVSSCARDLRFKSVAWFRQHTTAPERREEAA